MAWVAPGGRCRCCPYGQHIDTGFVSFAEDVARGASNKRTPTMPRRNLMSPMDGLFSDSMENLMSDFEEILTVDKKPKEAMTFQQKRLQNGYTSDYTGYRTNNVHVPSTTPTRTFALDYSGGIVPPAKPVNRTPTTNGRSTPSAYTALGRTIAEIKTRNVESPLPDRDRGVFSRTGTPIDLGLPQVNGVLHHHHHHSSAPPQNGNGVKSSYEYREHREHTRELERPHNLTLPRTTPVEPKSSDFASLRRGREISVPEQETLSRVRYFSASPKLPRRLQPAPPLQNPSNFTYSQQNGHTVLSKSQGTCTSPAPPEKIEKKVERATVATSTGPLPPQKPCGECHGLRKELQEALKRIPPPKPASFSIALGTDKEIEKESEKPEVPAVETTTTGSATEKVTTEERACSPIKWALLEFGCQTEGQETAAAETQVEKETNHGATQYDAPISCHFGTNTEPLEEKKTERKDQETMPTPKYFRNIPSQTEEEMPPPLPASGPPSPNDGPSCSDTASQTDGESCEPRVLEDSEIAESLWLMPGRETAEIAVGPDDEEAHSTAYSEICHNCQERGDVFTRHVGVGACSITDKVCVSCDNCTDEVDENDVPGFQQPKKLDGHQVAAVKKLLTSEQKQPFVRGSHVTKSARIERKKSDEMAWVEMTRRAPSASPVVPPSRPMEDTSDALKNKVILKKEVPPPPSSVPDPVPARIPRPKISKYAPPEENAETPDEEEEASDRLTPLRSEMRTLGRWRGGPREVGRFDEEDEEEILSDEEDEGSYETHEDGMAEGTPFEVTGPLREALVSLNSHLLQPGSISVETADWALKYVQHEWHKTAARKSSHPSHVEAMVSEMKQLSPLLVKTVVNMVDQNDNTALHYAVSHGNFDIVSALLDSGECQLNLANKAGYTAVMLAALCSLEDEVERTVVQRLFEMGNVNARATQHGQTALMLAVSHGKKTAAVLLLACGADVNMQDEEGSTALMCAAEHGHRELVKLLLSCNGIDAALTDCDSSTALSIAVENGHRDIGVLIYAHLNIMKERWSEPMDI